MEPQETAGGPQEGSWKRGFWSLIATQFQGAFSENALKYLVIYLILGAALSQQQRDFRIQVVALLFSIPFVLFSMNGGFLADRFSKRSVTIGTKIFEAGVMLVALAGLAMDNLPIQFVAVFLAATQGALFSPSKYGLLPEMLPEKLLSWGNGVLELGTFLAIITGSLSGAVLAEKFAGRQVWSGALLFALTALGLLASLGIQRVPARRSSGKLRLNFVGELFTQVRFIRADRVLWLAILGNTYFWFLGALLQYNLVFFGTDTLHLTPTRTSLLNVALAVGIGVGSLLAGYLSGGKIEYGLIPLGAVGMAAFAGGLSLEADSLRSALVLLAGLGLFGGFAIVPLSAMIQHRPPGDRKGGVLGASSLLSFVGIILGPVVHYGLKTFLHFHPPDVFLFSALVTLAAAAYAVWMLPEALVRLVLWLLTHSVYRIRVEGRDNIPEKGGALFVCNHMSFVDALLLIASTDRFIRFVMFKDIYEHPVVKPFARIMRVIPISSQQRPREMIRSLRDATEAIQNGEGVCIFAEGQITRIGQLLPFRRGFERIMKGVEAPIVPVHLDGVWGSIFSFEKGRFLWKAPRHIPYPVTVTYGKPLPATARAFEVRQAVQDLGTQAFALRKKRMKPLHRGFLRTCRRHPLRFAMADGLTPRLSFGTALLRVVFLSRRLRKVWEGQPMVGILMPPSVAGALVNLAALLMGKVAVNLNYTASKEVLESCARQCGLRTVLTSRAFLERLPVPVPAQAVLLEDLAGGPRFTEKLAAALVAWLLPAAFLEKACGRERPGSLDDLATVIFSSGSTGDPKGVLLSHFNVAANVRQVGQVFMLGPRDRMLGILPFFHSFGFTGTLCLPAELGVGVVYHPNPLDARTVGALCQQYAVTFLLATPTFLQAYTRRCTPEDFGSVQFVMAGAEKLPERIAQAFEDKFGIRPLEGYGCTECAPVVSVNTRDFRAAGFRQVGAKRGTIGHPLPGISIRIVHPETLEAMPPGQQGLLLVRGPNLMQGYLNRPEQNAEVLKDGWYNTGDLAVVEEDGFLTIHDRLSRFSKIGGEMVPHLRVEEKLHEAAGATEQRFAVAAVPDNRKGERLVILHTLSPEQLQECLARFALTDLPPLWRPRPNQFFRVEQLPYLGTGKLDLRRIKELALRLSPTESFAAEV